MRAIVGVVEDDRAFAGLEDEVFAGLSVEERCQLWNLLRQALDGGAEPAH